MNATRVRPSEGLWKEGSGYYTQKVQELRKQPLLPDMRRLRDRRLFEIFDRHANVTAESHVLEIGCGRSAWLPYLGRRMKCAVVGIDIEPYAAELARANLEGAGVQGQILCRDAFDLKANEDLRERFDVAYSMGVMEHFDDAAERLATLAEYLKHDGHILTIVPNMQALNGALQRLGDHATFEMHVVHSTQSLVQVHEAAGFETAAAGYVGFFDGYVTSAAGAPGWLRRRIHGQLCWTLNICAEAWVRLSHGSATPEMSWTAPYVFYVGKHVSSRS
jgi:2-polyprenyl-3-methyl-5-hydroxy-6-metoxy-1,4-benzoquinol methylase